MSLEWPIRMEIPRATPSLNELRGRKYKNPHDYRRLRETWEWEFGCAIRRSIRKEITSSLTSHPRMRLLIVCRRKRLLDPDNLIGGLKPVIDALKNLGLIYDDSGQYLEAPMPTQQKCKKGRAVTIFTLEPAS